jgi:hypothetical protein
MQTGLGDAYYFELNRLAFGDRNPFAYNIAGVPDEMRNVAPGKIRGLYTKTYHLGPTTGFIFVVDPKEMPSISFSAYRVICNSSRILSKFADSRKQFWNYARTPNCFRSLMARFLTRLAQC